MKLFARVVALFTGREFVEWADGSFGIYDKADVKLAEKCAEIYVLDMKFVMEEDDIII